MGRLFWENVLRLFLGRGRLFQGGCFKEGVWGGLFGGGGACFGEGFPGLLRAVPVPGCRQERSGAEGAGGGRSRRRVPVPPAPGAGPGRGRSPGRAPRRLPGAGACGTLRGTCRGTGRERSGQPGGGGGGTGRGVPQKRGAARPWRGPGRRYRGGTRGPGQDGAPG